MRCQTIIILTILTTLLCSMIKFNKTKIDNDFCYVFKTVEQLTKHSFAPSDHKKVDINKLNQCI